MSISRRVVLMCDHYFEGTGQFCDKSFVTGRDEVIAARGDAYQLGWRSNAAGADRCPRHAKGWRA